MPNWGISFETKCNTVLCHVECILHLTQASPWTLSYSQHKLLIMATISSPRPQSPASTTRVQSPQVPPSPSQTPTSSVRASLDLPTPTNARSSSPAPAATNQRRNRAALRDYYNLKSKPPGPHIISRTASNASTTSTATVTSTAVPDTSTNATDSTSISTAPLDDPSFEAEPYIANLLATADLKTVLKVEATLISEIRNLDGERKALVYDNYSKLIKATRTIGGMRINMDGGGGGGGGGRSEVGRRDQRRGERGSGLSEDGMRDLGKRLEGVRRLAEELGSGGGESEGPGAAEQRNKAKEEREKRQLVRWVLDGPRRLRKMVDGGHGQDAQREWKVIRGLLEKWEGVRGVEETRIACEVTLQAEKVDEEGHGAG